MFQMGEVNTNEQKIKKSDLLEILNGHKSHGIKGKVHKLFSPSYEEPAIRALRDLCDGYPSSNTNIPLQAIITAIRQIPETEISQPKQSRLMGILQTNTISSRDTKTYHTEELSDTLNFTRDKHTVAYRGLDNTFKAIANLAHTGRKILNYEETVQVANYGV